MLEGFSFFLVRQRLNLSSLQGLNQKHNWKLPMQERRVILDTGWMKSTRRRSTPCLKWKIQV